MATHLTNDQIADVALRDLRARGWEDYHLADSIHRRLQSQGCVVPDFTAALDLATRALGRAKIQTGKA